MPPPIQETRHPLLRPPPQGRRPAVPGPALLGAAAGLLSLQRSVGNRAVSRLLAGPGPGALPVQRVLDPVLARDIASQLDTVLKRVRRQPSKIKGLKGSLKSLRRQLEDASFDESHPSAFKLVDDLCGLAERGAKADQVRDVLAALDPTKPSWTHVAGASMPMGRKRDGWELANAGAQGDLETLTEQASDRGEKAPELQALINLALKQVDRAYEHHLDQVAGEDLSQTVLVFLGPEWMFRYQDRPLTDKERETVVTAFRQSSLLYPEMVIVPGTIVSGRPRKEFQGSFKDIANTVVVVWNGQELHRHDKQENIGDTWDWGEESSKRYGAKVTGQSPFFQVGNLRFAIDICGDHIRKRAQQLVGSGEEPPADIHLVPSAGQSPSPQNTATRPGGYMLGADVSGSGAQARTYHPGQGPNEGDILEGKVLAGEGTKSTHVLAYFDPVSLEQT